MTQEDSTLRFLDVPMEREVLGVGIPAGRQYASILLTDTLRANFARRGLLTDGKPQRYALTEFFVESYGEEGYQYHRTASRILQSQHDPNVYTNIVDGRGVFFGQGRASIKVYLDERDQERVYDLLED